jgi:hypothetical protein
MTARLPMPPYARDFCLHHKAATPWIFVGPEAWTWAKSDTRRKLVMPPDSRPEEFRWPVAGLEPVVLDTGASDDLLQRVAHELLKAGALSVAVVPHDSRKALAMFRRGDAYAAA